MTTGGIVSIRRYEEWARHNTYFACFAAGVLLAAALTTPIGTLVSYLVVSQIESSLLGQLLALSAGALIYVGATQLLSRAEREPHRFSVAALAAGVAVALVGREPMIGSTKEMNCHRRWRLASRLHHFGSGLQSHGPRYHRSLINHE